MSPYLDARAAGCDVSFAQAIRSGFQKIEALRFHSEKIAREAGHGTVKVGARVSGDRVEQALDPAAQVGIEEALLRGKVAHAEVVAREKTFSAIFFSLQCFSTCSNLFLPVYVYL